MKLHLRDDQLKALHVAVNARRTTRNVTASRTALVNLLMDYDTLLARVEDLDRSLAMTHYAGRTGRTS